MSSDATSSLGDLAPSSIPYDSSRPKLFAPESKIPKVLLITGLALFALAAATLATTLIIGGALATASVIAISFSETIIITSLTTAGKVVVVSSIVSAIGLAMASIGLKTLPRVYYLGYSDAEELPGK